MAILSGKRVGPAFLLIVLSLLGTVGVLLSTVQGIGTFSDSQYYIGGAKQLLNPQENSKAQTRWPPLYPALLAFVGLFGIDLWNAARWLNALFFGADIVLVGWIIARCTNALRGFSVFGSFLFLTSPEMLSVHSYVMSEPPFLFLALLGFVLLDIYFENGRRGFLVSSAAIISLASLTRYVGVTLAAAAVSIILLRKGNSWFNRWKESILFGLVSCLPVALWAARNFSLAGQIGGRKLEFHPINASHVSPAFDVLVSWVYPSKAGFPEPIKSTLFLIVAGLILYWAMLLIKSPARPADEAIHTGHSRIPSLLVAFIVIYLLFLVVSISFMDAQTRFSARHLSVIYVCVLVLLSYLAYRITRSVRPGKNVRIASLMVVLLVGVAYASASVRWVIASSREGLGYGAKEWKSSDLIQAMRLLPADIILRTNSPRAVSFNVPGRRVFRTPYKYSEQTLFPNARLRGQLKRLRSEVLRCKAVVAWFRAVEKPLWVSEEEFLQEVPAVPVKTNRKGTIYAGPDCTNLWAKEK